MSNQKTLIPISLMSSNYVVFIVYERTNTRDSARGHADDISEKASGYLSE